MNESPLGKVYEILADTGCERKKKVSLSGLSDYIAVGT